MALNCGIVGLPNVGKSTIFSALTSAPAEAANYPFSTIEPNVGIVGVPDRRLAELAEVFQPKKVIPAIVEFVDIAGLVKGASKGEGLGNQFLARIREVGAIVQVVRCFVDPDIIHVAGKVDPLSDIETIETELALADLAAVESRFAKTEKLVRSPDKETGKAAKLLLPLLERLKAALAEGTPARRVDFTPDETALVAELQLLTAKRQIYVCNVDEAGLAAHLARADIDEVVRVDRAARTAGSESIVICGKLEAEIAALEGESERAEFLRQAGLEESGLSRLIAGAYRLLGLRTFFTAGSDEVRAWTITAGDLAPRAAGVIHSDFEKGFIKAEVYSYDDFKRYETEAKVREAGRLRMEGKEYLVQDGDIMHFRFST